MTKLKYTAQSDDTDTRDSFPFPGSIRDLLSRTDPRAISPMELAESMGHTLDRMQLKLSELRRELDGEYRISARPMADDGHRPAA